MRAWMPRGDQRPVKRRAASRRRVLTGCTQSVRKLLQRGSFTSVADLQSKVLEFIAYYNRTMAKPFKWTYQGKPLVA
jgi:hypothetical protein